MKISSTHLLAASALALLATGCIVRTAPAPVAAARHPAYLHALTDLRHARAHLQRPANNSVTNWDENVAIREIDAAIGELSQAAANDGKNLNAQPPVDLPQDWSGRLHRGLELLERARGDTAREEDNPNPVGGRAPALQHMDAAIGHVRQGIAAASGPVVVVAPPPVVVVAPGRGGDHPHYLHALEDLRHARAHLEQPAAVRRQTAWDEAVAVREIDAAIHEIKAAAIDDGKNIGDHPPVDVRMDWRGRLHRTAELLRKADADCRHEEDNAFAQGLQRRALQHIDAALSFVQQGIAANHF